jgi:hypothetical protein
MPLDEPFIQATPTPATPLTPSAPRSPRLMLVDENFDASWMSWAPHMRCAEQAASAPQSSAPVDQSGFFLGNMRLG